MKKYLIQKKVIGSLIVAVLIILGLSAFFYNKGRISTEDWNSISIGMNKETVSEYLGSPASKTINGSEISDTYHNDLFATAMDTTGVLEESMEDLGYDMDALSSLMSLQDRGDQIEMYTYKIDNSKHYIYFVDGNVFTKK